MKTYITFGFQDVHAINGKTFDKDCVAVIDSDSSEQGREKAFEIFGSKFCMEYFDEEFNDELLKYYPRGLIAV